MMRARLVTVTVALLLFVSIMFPSAIADFISRPEHDFECGENEPPSGPYLDHATGTVMEYDCQTQTLTPGVSAMSTCHYVEGRQGEFVPIYGFCIGMSYVQCDEGPCNERHDIKTLVAATGKWSYSWRTYYDEGEGGELESCSDAPCITHLHVNPCVSSSLVTYCEDGKESTPLCPGHEITVKGELMAESGDLQEHAPESQSVRICN